MNKIHIGSFYTDDTPYQQVVYDYLLPSCLRLGIEPMVERVPNQGSWIKNVAEKPRIILQMLLKLKRNELLVFVDADATIEEYPVELESISRKYEIGYHTLNWNEWYGYRNVVPVKELLSGTMFFRNTLDVVQLCTKWYNKAKETQKWEQKVLQDLMPQFPQEKIYHLPVEYCYVTSLPDGREPLVKYKPIIKHYQKSREYKRNL